MIIIYWILDVYGTILKCSCIFKLTKFGVNISGGSQDWVKAEAGVKYSYTMELRDKGRYAFHLPVEQILDTSKEALAAFTVLSQKVKTGKYVI